jgi:hypothetical protein
MTHDVILPFFWRKLSVICAQLHRLIPRILWDLNGWQPLPKSFNTATCLCQKSNLKYWLSCGGSNHGRSYQVQKQSSLNQLTIDYLFMYI